jgi:undecaprenyl-phosphate glucose phosphotransferase
MLAPRQEGLVSIHALGLSVLVVGLFVWFGKFMDEVLWINLLPSINRDLYMLAVFVGMLFAVGPCYRWGPRLGDLTFFEALRLTWSQTLRLVLVLFAAAFATKDTDVSRVFLSSFIVLAFFFILSLNLVVPPVLARFVFRGNRHRTLFIGPPADFVAMEPVISAKRSIGMDSIGYLCGDGDEIPPGSPQPAGRIEDLADIIQHENVREILMPLFYRPPDGARAIMQTAHALGCRVRLVNDFGTTHHRAVNLYQEGSFTICGFDREPLENPANRIIKRAFDLCFSIPVVVFVLPPLCLVVWIVQRFQSPGPLFFKQPRYGLTQDRFDIFKFRTMHSKAPTIDEQKVQARKGDPRIYAFGRFLRRSSLDEFPQFLNVVLGEMSVVGPRPHLTAHDEEFARLVSEYRSRQFVKPGVTGLAQCRGFRGEIGDVSMLEKRIAHDLAYIREWSLLLDMRLVCETVREVLFPPKSAY